MRPLLLLALPFAALAQPACPPVNFLETRTVNVAPAATTHIDAIRQADGSYTAFQANNAYPYQVISTIPDFQQQFDACLPHPLPFNPFPTPIPENPPGAGSQPQVVMTLPAGGFFMASLAMDNLNILFDLFDSQHNLLSETTFNYYVPVGNVDALTDIFTALLLADVNSDGNLDLIAAFGPGGLSSEAGVWVFLGNGDGTFQTGTRQVLVPQAGAFGYPSSIAASDLNGDGKPDVALTIDMSGAVYVALGNGDGTFNPATAVPFSSANPDAISGTTVAIADLNKDGNPDLVIGNAPLSNESVSGVAALLGNGSGGFGNPTVYPVLQSASTTNYVALGDANGDGIPDIVSSGGSILFGDGTGAFPSRADYPQENNANVMIADINGDGIADLVFGVCNPQVLCGSSGYPSVNVLFGTGQGAFAGAPASGVGDAGVDSPLVIADLNGDGLPDALEINALGIPLQLTTLFGQGNGEFAGGPTSTFPAYTDIAAYAAVTADFTHDGNLDLAILDIYPAVEILVFPGNGAGSFAAPVASSIADQTLSYIATADFNNDGIPDLLLVSSTAIYVWLGKGDGTFTQSFTTAATNPSTTIADFNGDGKPDIAFANSGSTSLTVLLGKGDGTFPQFTTTTLPSAAAGFFNTMTTADFNGDGHTDIAVMLGNESCCIGYPTGASEIFVLLGKGDGTFPNSQSTSGFLASPVATDINLDGIPDLVGDDVDYLSVRLGNGDGTFRTGIPIASSASFSVSDLARSGRPDIAAGFGGVTAFMNLDRPSPIRLKR